MGKDLAVNIYTDSRYAFATARVHGAIYQERGLLTAEGKTIKNQEEGLQSLKALWLPKRLANIHCPGHQKGDTMVARGNKLADKAAREIAVQSSDDIPAINLLHLGDPRLPEQPHYTPEEVRWAKNLPMSQLLQGWWRSLGYLPSCSSCLVPWLMLFLKRSSGPLTWDPSGWQTP